MRGVIMGGRGSSSGIGGGTAGGLRADWDPSNVNAEMCQTKEELIDYFDKVLDIKVDEKIFDNVDYEIARWGLVGIDEMLDANDYTIIVRKIGVDANYDAIAYHDSSTNGIYFAKSMCKADVKYYKDIFGKNWEKEYLEHLGFMDGQTYYHPKAKAFTLKECMKQVMAHETAHALEATISWEKKGLSSCRMGVSDQIVLQAYKNLFGASKDFEKVSALPTVNGHFKKQCAKISGYANYHSGTRRYGTAEKAVHYYWETWAEAHADVYSNGDKANPFSKEIVRLAKEYRYS